MEAMNRYKVIKHNGVYCILDNYKKERLGFSVFESIVDSFGQNHYEAKVRAQALNSINGYK